MDRHFTVAKQIVSLLYTQFSAGRFRFGFYSFFAFIPGLGDIISVLLAVYIMWIAVRVHVPFHKLAVMMGNILLDLAAGTLPLAGDVIDTVYKSHVKNIKVVEEYIPRHVVEGEFT